MFDSCFDFCPCPGFKLPSQPPSPGLLKSDEKEPVNEPSDEPEGVEEEELEKETEENEAEKEKPAGENKPTGILTQEPCKLSD